MGEAETIVAATAVAKDSAEQSEVEDPSVVFAVENYLPENVPTFYSDGMVVVHSPNEFIVSFLLTEFPLAVGKDELEKEKTTPLKRKCVTRIIMSPTQFEQTTKALQENLKKYQNSYRTQDRNE